MTHDGKWQLRWISENSLRLYLKSSRRRLLIIDCLMQQDREILSMSDFLIPVQVKQSLWLHWFTNRNDYLNHFRTWNLAHIGVIHDTVSNDHHDALEVNWSDYRPSPEA